MMKMKVTKHDPVQALLAIFFVSLLTLWPTFINGQPFYMPDTTSYVRTADAGIYKITGMQSEWTDEYEKRFSSAEKTRQKNDANYPQLNHLQYGQTRSTAPVALSGRSVYYGFFLYAGQLGGNFWLVAFIQAFLASSAVIYTIGNLTHATGSQRSFTHIVLISSIIAALTPIGYFASYLMPDIFGGLGILALANLAFFWARVSWAEKIFWFALLSASLLFHTSNLLLISALTGILIAALWLKFVPVSGRAIFASVLAILIAFAGQSLFVWGVTAYSGNPPISPPFLAARLIEDGPGYDYLEEHCPEYQGIYCRVLNFASVDHDSLLWSDDPRLGIFQALPTHEQRRAAAEQNSFIVSVIRERPLEVINSSFSAFFLQLASFDLAKNFNYLPQQKMYFDNKIPQKFQPAYRNSQAYKGTMPTTVMKYLTIILFTISVIYLLAHIWLYMRRNGRLDGASSFALTVMLAIFANAAICGGISGTKGRYQMRIIWILPLTAIAIFRSRPKLQSVSDKQYVS